MEKIDTQTPTLNQKVNFGFAIYLIALPLVVSFFDLLGITANLEVHLLFWGFFYLLFLLFSLFKTCCKGQKIRISFNFNYYTILTVCMIGIMLISSTVNQSFRLWFFLYLVMFLIFICISTTDKSKNQQILDLLLIVLGICCIMGFVDPFNKFMPGFNKQSYPLSLQFMNPNYSGAVMAAACILCYLKLGSYTNKKSFVFYCILYLIFTTHLFMNGSFTPISSVVLAQIFSLTYFSLKNKKFNYTLLIFSASAVAICFLVDLIPNIANIRTCDYNYFLECIAVFDNIFNTNMLGSTGIDQIKGSDGWDRRELMSNSLKHCTSSAKNFLFGCGAGTYHNFRPHNTFLSLWLDFGIFMPIVYSAFWIGMFVKLLKLKYDELKAKHFVVLSTLLLSSVACSFVFYSGYVLIILLAVFFKNQQKTTISPNATKKL